MIIKIKTTYPSLKGMSEVMRETNRRITPSVSVSLEDQNRKPLTNSLAYTSPSGRKPPKVRASAHKMREEGFPAEEGRAFHYRQA